MRNTHVLQGLPRARGMLGTPVVPNRVVPEGQALMLQGQLHVHPDAIELMRELQDYGAPHSPEAHEVITAELVACTLGARHRPELIKGELAKRLAEAGKALTTALTGALVPFRDAMRRLADAEAEHQRRLHERAAQRD